MMMRVLRAVVGFRVAVLLSPAAGLLLLGACDFGATPTPLPTATPSATATATVTPIPSPTAPQQPTRTPQPTPAMTALPAEEDEIKLGPLVTSRAVAAGDNAPVDRTDLFAPDETVYAVTRVHVFAAGHRVFARWRPPSGPNEDTAEIVANQTYRDTYLEFHIAGTANNPLPVGRYEVQLFVDGQPGPEAVFSVGELD